MQCHRCQDENPPRANVCLLLWFWLEPADAARAT
jgi:hypothetical protein